MNWRNSSVARLSKTHPSLNTALFSIPSQSLMFCAVPKIASKTLISLFIYVHVRDILQSQTNNSTDQILNRRRSTHFIHAGKLADQLRKNGIFIPIERRSPSVISFLQSYLHLLRTEKINDTSLSLFVNPWRFNLKEIFPGMYFSNLDDMSHIYTSSFTRTLFVRHPFERLASAYKERIAILDKDRLQPEPHYDNVRRTICYRFMLVNTTRLSWATSKQCQDVIPSFEHFVQYILTNTDTPAGIARMDTHWLPYTIVCQVCHFQYNFIGKYETFHQDFAALLKRLNVSDWNVQKRRGASGHGAHQYRQLFSALPDRLICRLKKLYHDDLRLFNYRVEDYVNRTMFTC